MTKEEFEKLYGDLVDIRNRIIEMRIGLGDFDPAFRALLNNAENDLLKARGHLFLNHDPGHG